MDIRCSFAHTVLGNQTTERNFLPVFIVPIRLGIDLQVIGFCSFVVGIFLQIYPGIRTHTCKLPTKTVILQIFITHKSHQIQNSAGIDFFVVIGYLKIRRNRHCQIANKWHQT